MVRKGSNLPDEPTACPSCGAHARTRKAKCALCGGSLAETVALPSPEDSIHWVQARLKATCPTCRTQAPVERLDADRFHCFPCQRVLPFPAGFWQEQLRYGAAAGDCFWSCFDHMSWRWPPIGASLGDEDAAQLKELRRLFKGAQQQIDVCTDFERTPGRAGRLTMAPGHPLCDACRAPLSARFGDHGVVTLRCDACDREKSYQAPADALAACTELVAVVAPDHLQGVKSVQTQTDQQTAAVAITCPGCGGPLDLDPGEPMTTCSFCQLESIVPTGVMAHAFREPPPEQPIWLAMRAPSALQLRYKAERRAKKRRRGSRRSAKAPEAAQPETPSSRKSLGDAAGFFAMVSAIAFGFALAMADVAPDDAKVTAVVGAVLFVIALAMTMAGRAEVRRRGEKLGEKALGLRDMSATFLVLVGFMGSCGGVAHGCSSDGHFAPTAIIGGVVLMVLGFIVIPKPKSKAP